MPASKSESNRALVINALANGTIDNLSNLAEARDTQTMIRLLSENGVEADVLDAGTTMRFLTAYYAVTGATKKMTGTPRMCERPIGILVDALRTLGADITYLNQEGYPPMQLNGFSFKGNREISIRGDVSSQFISALLMVAPLLPDGLKMQITGALGSKPYIEMTLAQMKHLAFRHQRIGLRVRLRFLLKNILCSHLQWNRIGPAPAIGIRWWPCLPLKIVPWNY